MLDEEIWEKIKCMRKARKNKIKSNVDLVYQINHFSIEEGETIQKAWTICIVAIDEAKHCLNNKELQRTT